MASNALGVFPRVCSSFPCILRRRNLTSCFSISSSRSCRNRTTTRRLAVSISAGMSTVPGEKLLQQPLDDQEPLTAVSLNQFFQQAKELVTSVDDVEPPRWFSPSDCGHPLQGSPLLLFLPGIDGTGLGLIMHHQKLGRMFEVICLHIPPKDRTPFTELVKLVESRVRSEHDRSPHRPIYLVGESLGACLALSVAAFNPHIDLVLILANPATSFSRSQLQPILHLLQFLPADFPNLSLLHILTGAMMASLDEGLKRLLLDLVTPSMAHLSVITDILPIETLVWKLEMISQASSYANSHLHGVKAQTLILSSGRDLLLPSHGEGQRLRRLLVNCDMSTFEDCGHFLFLEDGFDLVSVIKKVGLYRRSKERDFVSDFIRPSPSELSTVWEKYKWISTVTSPVVLSTLGDGKIVRGFGGVPSEGPVLYVGYHMLLGSDLLPLVAQFLEQTTIPIRGLAHPLMFMKSNHIHIIQHIFDDLTYTGGVPVSGKNIFKLLSTKSHVLLYPGGVREALHRKGEAYKLFWPERSEFVRMAARFGATIIPFGSVGEDDLAHLFFDYEEQMKFPLTKQYIDELSERAGKVRATNEEEVGNQALHVPGVIPKFPGRFYFCFGKPIETQGRKQELRDKEKAHELYLQVKSEVENCLAYLQEKRESDPYRSLVSRMIYQFANGFAAQVPTFDLD